VLRRLTELLEERRSWYEQADVHVQLGKDSSLEPQEVAKRVLAQVKQRIASDGTRERIRQGAENMHEPLNL
jgi:shikimate kinase